MNTALVTIPTSERTPAQQLSHARNRAREWMNVAMNAQEWAVRVEASRKVAYWRQCEADIYETLECDPYAPDGSRDEPGWAESQPSIQ